MLPASGLICNMYVDARMMSPSFQILSRRQRGILKTNALFWSSWVLPSAAARACSIGIRIMMGIIVTVFLVMSHEMQSAVNKSQLCLLLLWCTKVQDEELELQVTLPYFTMRLQKDCVSSFFFFPKTFSWRSNDMTVIEVSLRQIYHM